MDGGGSRTRCAAFGLNGELLADIETGPSNHLQVERELVVQSLTEAVRTVMAKCARDLTDVICVSAGLAGVDVDGTGSDEMAKILEGLGFQRLVINGDMVIAHAGALGGDPGVIALAGTGSSILGVNESGERVKVGGWGPIFGDEGSAYRIGQEALRASARAFDGRGPTTALTDVINYTFGLNSFSETLGAVYSNELKPRDIAALSRPVYAAAEAGDETARNIFLKAGEELADCVDAAIRRLKMDSTGCKISYQGAVLESCAIARESFSEQLIRIHSNCQLIPPMTSPLAGAYLLGLRSIGIVPGDEILSRLASTQI